MSASATCQASAPSASTCWAIEVAVWWKRTARQLKASITEPAAGVRRSICHLVPVSDVPMGGQVTPKLAPVWATEHWPSGAGLGGERLQPEACRGCRRSPCRRRRGEQRDPGGQARGRRAQRRTDPPAASAQVPRAGCELTLGRARRRPGIGVDAAGGLAATWVVSRPALRGRSRAGARAPCAGPALASSRAIARARFAEPIGPRLQPGGCRHRHPALSRSSEDAPGTSWRRAPRSPSVAAGATASRTRRAPRRGATASPTSPPRDTRAREGRQGSESTTERRPRGGDRGRLCDVRAGATGGAEHPGSPATPRHPSGAFVTGTGRRRGPRRRDRGSAPTSRGQGTSLGSPTVGRPAEGSRARASPPSSSVVAPRAVLVCHLAAVPLCSVDCMRQTNNSARAERLHKL